MLDALFISASGMQGQQLQIDAIAHNMANINTVGFRRGMASFEEVSASLTATETMGMAPMPVMNATLRGSGVASRIVRSSLPGELRQTGDPMDVAIDGHGFIEVTRADGSPAYTRAGKLMVSNDGWLATADGSPLAAMIEIPIDARELNILEDGRVTVRGRDDGQPMVIGQLELVAFSNPAALQVAGHNLYVASEASGELQIGMPGELSLGTLRQGYLESSNVNMADEMVTLMLAQRAFELNARVVQAADQMLSITNGLYR